MKKLIISEQQFKANQALLEGCGCDVTHSEINELGKKATIHVANQVKNTTNREEKHYNDTFRDHDKKKISFGKYLDIPENHKRIKRGMELFDNEGNKVLLDKVVRIPRGYRVHFKDENGVDGTKNALSLSILV